MMLKNQRLGFVGAGNVAQALIRGLLGSKRVLPENITIAGRRRERTAATAERLGVKCATDCVNCVASADIVFLCVEPQSLPKVLPQVREGIRHDALVISVAAGASTRAIAAHLPGQHVVRAMPNTGAAVRHSATAVAPGVHSTDEDVTLAREIFDCVGITILVDEVDLDAVTGLSGSGPAFMFLLIDAFADAGVKVGLSREVALALATHTMLGSALHLLESKEHPGRLRDQVTSPGGTAIKALHTMEEGRIRYTIIKAVEDAAVRSKELGDTISAQITRAT